MKLSEKTITIVKATSGSVIANAEAITTRMYEILFSSYPELKELFKDADPNQHKKLAAALSAYAANIDNLGVLSKTVEKMASTHVRVKVRPEHYPIVGLSLLSAVKDVLGEAASDDVIKAWEEAYFFLANILIAREKELYATA